jgi:hypothetical protein
MSEEKKKTHEEKNESSDECCGGKGFNFGRLFFGIVVLAIGLIYLLNNLGITNIQFDLTFNIIWPIIVIGIGLSILSGKGWFSMVLGIIVILILIAVGVFIFAKSNMLQSISNSQSSKNEIINIAKDAKTTDAIVNVKTGAGNLNISGSANGLVDGDYKSNNLTLNQENKMNSTTQEVTFSLGNDVIIWPQNYQNDLNLGLSSLIPMVLNIDTGAMTMNLDLKNIMAKNVNVKTGASKLDITMGDKLDLSNLDINAGASTITINLPSTVGASLHLDSGLTSKNLKDFQEVSSGNYQSANYNSSAKKINLDLDLGATELDVSWY